MEQHPVPQNVTTFQFRLIGDMTIKQFGYLIGGGIAAVLAYKLPMPILFTWPLTGAFALLGIGLAFVPIEERPMDVWILSFLKNVYSPTQYLWQKDAALAISQQQTQPKAPEIIPRLAQVASPLAPTLPHTHVSRSWQQRLGGMFAQTPKSAVPPAVSQPQVAPGPVSPPTQTVTPPAPPPTEEHHQMADMQNKLQELQKELQSQQPSQARIAELQKQLTEVMSEKDQMEKELMRLKQQAAPPVPAAAPPRPMIQPTPQVPKPTVSVIDQPGAAIRAGIPRLTTFPNIPTGIIKDIDGNMLPAILVTIKDKDDVPLRALKTNKLGQFAASTQMPNGVYLVEAEDPRKQYVFDRAQITLNGSVMPALEITAKSQKQLNRDKMAKELFGNQNVS